MNSIDYIKEKTTTKQLLELLSEELAELYQAYCKYHRASSKVPGAVISLGKSREMIIEEISDVLLIWRILENAPAYIPNVSNDDFKKNIGLALMILLTGVNECLDPKLVTLQLAVCISKIHSWCYDNAFDAVKVENIQKYKLKRWEMRIKNGEKNEKT